MFFILSKLFHFLILPINWVFGLLIAAVFAKEKRKGLLIAALTVMYIYTTDFVIGPIFWVWEVPAVWHKELPNDFDAVIVLGGISAPGKLPDDRVHFPGSPDRLLHAMQLYKLGKAKKIILSGGSGELVGKRIPEAAFLQRELVLCGVDSNDVIIESASKNTRENALFSAKVAAAQFRPEAKFILVTSAYHMRRSLGCFRKVGLQVTGFSTNADTSEEGLQWAHFVPNPISPLRWHALIHEWVGYVSYKANGYL